MQNIEEVKLKKYKNTRKFVYDDRFKNVDFFTGFSMLAMFFNAVFGTIFLIFDIFSIPNKILPISLILLNIMMCFGYYLVMKKEDNSTSYKYRYFLPNLYVGLSGIYSSFIFLYTTNEILVWTFGSCAFTQNYMTLVIMVFILIIIVQFIWYIIALKKGYYCDHITYESSVFKVKMNRIAKILVIPTTTIFIAILPFAHGFIRIIVHPVDSYPLQFLIFVTLFLIFPFMCAFSYPVFIWAYLVWKYRKFIPKTVRSFGQYDYDNTEVLIREDNNAEH